MKRKLLFVILFVTFGIISFGQYVTIEGRQFKDENGEDFYPVVCNYLAQYIYDGFDTSTLFVSPFHEYDLWCYDCGGFTSCMNQMSDNFDKISEMGFNAIRLFGPQPRYLFDDVLHQNIFRIQAHDYNYWHSNDCNPSCGGYYYDYYLCEPFENNPTAQLIFTYLDTILIRASKSNLKVILLTGGRALDYSSDFGTMYAAYLSALAEHIHTVSPAVVKETLLAYDLENEPSASDNFTKQDVCQYVSMWYDSIKSHDPDHLVTIGGSSFLDVFKYDPALLKIDFYSPHYYPIKKSYFTAPFQTMIDQVHSHSIWLKNNVPNPYIIGETGFKSKPDNSGPDGDTIQQKQYADSTLEFTRYYSGSGYSWWEYQDYDWGLPDCYFGLLGRNGNHVIEKYVIEAFRSYDPNDPPSSHSPPDLYYDPYTHRALNPGNNHLTGHVYDVDLNPIQDALVYGWTYIGTDAFNQKVFETHYTFTDSGGFFEIIPYDNDPSSPDYEVMTHIRVSAVGCSRFSSSWMEDSIGVRPEEVDTIILQRVPFTFTDTIQDSVCSTAAYFQAWDNIYFKDVTVLTSVNFEARARREITLDQEFHAAAGSEAMIHLDHTWYPCGGINFDFQKEKSSFSDPQEFASCQPKALQLQFEPQADQFDFIIYPNPGAGLFTIELTSDISFDELELFVFDIHGQLVRKNKIAMNPGKLDFTGLSCGVYQVMVRNDQYCGVKKIIIN